MFDIIDTVARLICEVKPYNSSFGNLLVKLYILFVNLWASCHTGKFSNDLIVDKCLNLRFINLPIYRSAYLSIKINLLVNVQYVNLEILYYIIFE